ncbi:hypothetical protein [Wielerella bovis]|uniref:hypothetical protein n=1 Tax=Wielerella bovis TaxID=2917790 RepID=UPI002019F313|nr:hypothetical protein [Wielerella bovis]MCG7657622.1 hypothetical protein [Wielerella bovis]MCG7659843.1 hypothetical protein [Wielerella bovis]
MKTHQRKAHRQRLWAQIALLLTLSGCLYGAISPLQQFFAAQKKARDVLSQEVATLQVQLPPANTPDLWQVMPIKMNDHWRKGFKYYPERNAFKYTFAASSPEPLERRSVWFQPAGNQWRCYAGVKKKVRDNVCDDVQIIRGLKETEHQQAQYFENECTVFKIGLLRQLNLPSNTRVLHLSTKQKNQTIPVYLSRELIPKQNVLLLIENSHSEEEPLPSWTFFYEQGIHIHGVIVMHEQTVTLHGLPNHTPVSQYDKSGHCSPTEWMYFTENVDFEPVNGLITEENKAKISWQSAPTIWQNGTFSGSLKPEGAQ